MLECEDVQSLVGFRLLQANNEKAYRTGHPGSALQIEWGSRCSSLREVRCTPRTRVRITLDSGTGTAAAKRLHHFQLGTPYGQSC